MTNLPQIKAKQRWRNKRSGRVVVLDKVPPVVHLGAHVHGITDKHLTTRIRVDTLVSRYALVTDTE